MSRLERFSTLLKRASKILAVAFLLWMTHITDVYAQSGQVLAEYNLVASKFVFDTQRNRLYASLYSQNSVVIFNTKNLVLIGSVPVGSNPVGLAISADNNKLYIATSGASFLAVLDLNTLGLLPSIALPALPYDVEAGNNDRLFITPAVSQIGIMHVNAATGEYLGSFSSGVSVYVRGMLEISPDRKTLYFANSGLSPGTLAKYDVSTNSPQLLFSNPHGSLGSNGLDLALTQDGANISYAVGGGNGGYVIYKMSTIDFAVLGSFNTGAYPSEITYSPDGKRAYTVHTSGRIDVFDAQTFLEQPPITVVGQATELITDASGGYLFAAFDNILRIYDTGGGPIPPQLNGSLSGMSAGRIVCENRRTAQRVLIKYAPATLIWDCVAAGLTFSPGDEIRILITGAAD